MDTIRHMYAFCILFIVLSVQANSVQKTKPGKITKVGTTIADCPTEIRGIFLVTHLLLESYNNTVKTEHSGFKVTESGLNVEIYL